ncbi:hypothetical protein [Alicyclobacillus vulcanalis]|uniref:Uncharacterized protein n=1 Tax=Alicyclobacillus vulcanalis TaxID=252246 RepID=A0A1N7N470_9BACL|nr:hypothetical protein [Alicyclobacillus vulcanalis]SIS93134.1 hypothetical protein SAMN05421799_10757 [Alicyclobacillus vulcanalis]
MSSTLPIPDARRADEVTQELHALAYLVVSRQPHPRNPLEVAVHLEDCGYGDEAARAFGFRDVFELAEEVWSRIPLYQTPDELRRPSPLGWFRRALEQYFRGVGYTSPWMLSVLALFITRIALWSSLSASQEVATAVSLAFFVATACAGAVSQVFAVRALFYLGQGNWLLFRWIATRAIVPGSAASALVIALVYRFAIAPTYAPAYGNLFLEYAVAIYLFQIALAPLYMLRRILGLIITTGVALFVTWIAIWTIERTNSGAYGVQAVQQAQILGLCIAGAAALIGAYSYAVMRSRRQLRRLLPEEVGDGPHDRPTRDQARASVQIPRFVPVWRQLWLYAVYGTGYFAMLFVDRVVAGIHFGALQGALHYVYPPTYELTTDLATLELFPMMGFVFYFMTELSDRFLGWLRTYRVTESRGFHRKLCLFFATRVAILAAVGVAIGLVAPDILLKLPSTLIAPILVAGPAYIAALHIAAIVYGILPVGLFASQFLFFWGVRFASAWGVWAGTALGGTVAALAVSRGDAYAVYGMAAAIGCFVAITLIFGFRTAMRGDFHLYASH